MLPITALIIFTLWTMLLLATTIGVYRWGNVLFGQSKLTDFSHYEIKGADWYQRALRAHANCVENLPLFIAIAFGLYVTDASSTLINTVCLLIVVARVLQSLVHVLFTQTTAITTLRFLFFFTQYIGFFILSIIVLNHL